MRPARRDTLAMLLSLPLCALLPQSARARAQAQLRAGAAWSVHEAFEALQADTARMLDIRSRKEWQASGVARGAWPVSMHEPRFATRIFAARDLAEGRPVALICATGGRSGAVMRAILDAGHGGFVDVPEGMMGSQAGPGWIASGLPVLSLEEALAALPAGLV